ncbi:MAG: ACP S-malonyltransferase [Buchnera aphidicola (Schlechtendalia peitan)]
MEKKNNTIPIILAGHSLGEYSALVCSQSLKFYDAIKLIFLREKFMKESMNNKLGTMYVIIGLKKSNVEKILKNFEYLKNASIACINTSRQIVIAGEQNTVRKISIACKKAGAKKIFKLSVNPPSHCILMKNASQKLSIALKTIILKKPKFPVINNVDTKCETEPLAIKNALVRQLYSPVQWFNTIKYLCKIHVSMFIEAGLNNTLTNLNKFIVAIPSISLNNKIHLLKKL